MHNCDIQFTSCLFSVGWAVDSVTQSDDDGGEGQSSSTTATNWSNNNSNSIWWSRSVVAWKNSSTAPLPEQGEREMATCWVVMSKKVRRQSGGRRTVKTRNLEKSWKSRGKHGRGESIAWECASHQHHQPDSTFPSVCVYKENAIFLRFSTHSYIEASWTEEKVSERFLEQENFLLLFHRCRLKDASDGRRGSSSWPQVG